MPRGPRTTRPGSPLAGPAELAGGPASLVDLAMPYLRHLDPHRVAAIKEALQHLQLLQREGVLLMMPETAIPR